MEENANAWPPANCACVQQLFNSLLMPLFVQLFSENSSVNLFAVYPSNTHFFYQNLILVAEYHVDC